MSSYVNTESTGNVKIGGMDPVEGKYCLVVEDMYDTGTSMMKLLDHLLSNQKAAKVEACIAFHKKNPKNLKHNYLAEYTGFLVPNHFVIGYGMDINERFRDLKHLCQFSEKGKQTFCK